jgi:hypothetical protein
VLTWYDPDRDERCVVEKKREGRKIKMWWLYEW